MPLPVALGSGNARRTTIALFDDPTGVDADIKGNVLSRKFWIFVCQARAKNGVSVAHLGA
jgi:hypothetical protein